MPGGFREGFHRWDEEQQGNDGRDDHRHGPDEALDVCFVVYHGLFIERPELLDGFQQLIHLLGVSSVVKSADAVLGSVFQFFVFC